MTFSIYISTIICYCYCLLWFLVYGNYLTVVDKDDDITAAAAAAVTAVDSILLLLHAWQSYKTLFMIGRLDHYQR